MRSAVRRSAPALESLLLVRGDAHLLAMALLLLPSALPARRWQRSALLMATAGVLVEGTTTAFSGLLGRVVEVPVRAVASCAVASCSGRWSWPPRSRKCWS
jgi:hypothetical protein